MDLLLAQSEQASDQSLFSQKTEMTIGSDSVNSQADTMPIMEITEEAPHSSKDSECSSNRTVAGDIEVIPETEEFLSTQGDEAEVNREMHLQPEPTQSAACPVVQDSVVQDNATSSYSEPRDKNCSDKAPSNDGLSPQENGDASSHKKCESDIGDDRPASLGGDSGCEKSNRLLDSDDDAMSDSKFHATEHSPGKKSDPHSHVRRIFDSSDEGDDDVAKDSAPACDGESAGLKEFEEGKYSPDQEGELPHSHVRRILDSSDEECDRAAKHSDPAGDDGGGNLEDLEESSSTHSTHKKGRGERKSAKKAMEELREIYSTSQRMTRERRMSLPYHEPERLSLKAFLQQRRSGESHSSPVCKKEEQTIVPPQESTSTDLLLDDIASALTGPADLKPAEPSTANTTSPEKQPVVNNAQPSSDEKLETPLFSFRRRRTLAALVAGTVPCLSKEPVILLDSDGDHPEGVDHLLKRLVKHSKMEDSKKKKETIKAAAIVVPGIIEEGPVQEKGVSQLTLLKEKLLSKVRQQRNRSREQRYLQRCLDNEEIPPDGTVHLDDDAPKSPLALADELDEDENDFSDAHETSSGDEEEEDEDGNSSDEEVVLKHKKRAKKVNPVSDDEDDEDCGKTKNRFGKIVLDEEEEDSDGELHLEMPPFLDAEDNVDEPVIGDENRMESFVDSPLPANKVKTAETPLNQKYGAMRSYQSDEMELFSPLTGLPRTQSKTNTPKLGNVSASSSFQESPSHSTVSGAPTLAFSPLAGTAGTLTACRSLRRQFSEDFAKPWEGGTPAPINQSQDMEELVGLCSGSFAARTEANELEENEDDDGVDEALKASQDELGEDEADSGGEDEVPTTSKEEPAPRLQDFLEEEAELSGSDIGSDGEEDEDEEGVLADLIAAENEKEDTDQIREEIGRFHFKQLLDEDKRELKIYQELLLEDGDLHTDGAGRQRQFRWRNSGAIDDGNLLPGSDGEEDAQHETEQEADATWRIQRLERRRWLQEQETSPRPDTPSNGSFSEQDSLLKAPTVIAKQDLRVSKKVATKKGAMCGSFLRLDSGVLGRIAERIKVAVPAETEGSVTTKNFVFRAAEEKPKKRLSTSQPSQVSKKAKLKELSEQRDLAISVFNFM